MLCYCCCSWYLVLICICVGCGFVVVVAVDCGIDGVTDVGASVVVDVVVIYGVAGVGVGCVGIHMTTSHHISMTPKHRV